MYSIKLQVRDYECDLQGVVNNAVYQNYLEHARHKYLLSIGVDFPELTAQGIHLMVIRAELDYKDSLLPGDEFEISVKLARASRIKYLFVQEIRRCSDSKIMLKAQFTGVALNEKKRPFAFELFDKQLEEQANQPV